MRHLWHRRRDLFALAKRRLGVTENRGRFSLHNRLGFVTVHPAAVLPHTRASAQHAARKALEADLNKIRRLSIQARSPSAGKAGQFLGALRVYLYYLIGMFMSFVVIIHH